MSAAAELSDNEEAGTYVLSTSPSHLIHRAQQFAADCYLESTPASELTQRQFEVLTAIAAQEGLSQTALVRITGIDRSTLADLIKRLSTKELIARERAPHDARANMVRITPKGRKILDETRPSVTKADQAILAALPKSKRAAFLDALQRLTDVLDGADEADAPSRPPTKPSKSTKTDKKTTADGKSARKAKSDGKKDAKKTTASRSKPTKKKKAKAAT